MFVRAGLDPEVLQLKLFDHHGICYARLDFAWPSRKLAVEADGRETHDDAGAFQSDRVRQNKVADDGWTVLRYTWKDVVSRTNTAVDQVRRFLSRPPTDAGSR